MSQTSVRPVGQFLGLENRGLRPPGPTSGKDDSGSRARSGSGHPDHDVPAIGGHRRAETRGHARAGPPEALLESPITPRPAIDVDGARALGRRADHHQVTAGVEPFAVSDRGLRFVRRNGRDLGPGRPRAAKDVDTSLPIGGHGEEGESARSAHEDRAAIHDDAGGEGVIAPRAQEFRTSFAGFRVEEPDLPGVRAVGDVQDPEATLVDGPRVPEAARFVQFVVHVEVLQRRILGIAQVDEGSPAREMRPAVQSCST